MISLPSLEERRLAFEARRVSIETLIKIHVEQVQSIRHLVMVHLRMMFTLSLGSIAGIVTLYGAVLRFGSTADTKNIGSLSVALGITGLAAMVASAFLAASALQRSADGVMPYLQDPFPNSGPEIDAIFHADTHNELEILHNLYRTVENEFSAQPKLKTGSRLSTALLIVGLLTAGLSFLV
jgi:hypothetical protein